MSIGYTLLSDYLVQFDDLTEEAVASRLWTFDADQTATTKDPLYDFGLGGLFRIDLAVVLESGETVYHNETLYLQPRELSADATVSPTSGASPLEVSFEAECNYELYDNYFQKTLDSEDEGADMYDAEKTLEDDYDEYIEALL